MCEPPHFTALHASGSFTFSMHMYCLSTELQWYSIKHRKDFIIFTIRRDFGALLSLLVTSKFPIRIQTQPCICCVSTYKSITSRSVVLTAVLLVSNASVSEQAWMTCLQLPARRCSHFLCLHSFPTGRRVLRPVVEKLSCPSVGTLAHSAWKPTKATGLHGVVEVEVVSDGQSVLVSVSYLELMTRFFFSVSQLWGSSS
jgi:hypothetical protein